MIQNGLRYVSDLVGQLRKYLKSVLVVLFRMLGYETQLLGQGQGVCLMESLSARSIIMRSFSMQRLVKTLIQWELMNAPFANIL